MARSTASTVISFCRGPHAASRQSAGGYYKIPLGKANVVKGRALTIIAYGTMVHVALAAAAEMASTLRVIDLRTLVPIDIGRSSPPSKKPAAA